MTASLLVVGPVVDDLKIDEGFRSKPYYCHLKFPTIGYGIRIGPKNAPLDQYQFTVKENVAEAWLKSEVLDRYDRLCKRIPWYEFAPHTVQRVLLNMAYQLGVDGVLGFKDTLRLLERKEYKAASLEMLDSKWAKIDTPGRAQKLSNSIRLLEKGA